MIRASHFLVCSYWLLLLVLLSSTPVVNGLLPPPLVHTAVGAIAGSAGAFAAYPIDYVKSVLQTQEGRAKYKGGMEAAAQICRDSGPFGLYRGVGVTIIGVAPEKTVKLSANSFLRLAFMGYYGGTLPLAGEIVAGGLAGMSQVIVTNPLEVIKVKIQTSNMTATEVIKQLDGFKDLYQGAGACVLRDVSFSAILFPLYAHTKVLLLPIMAALLPEEAGPAFWADLLAGAFSAGPAAFIGTPADVIKTRIQQSRNDDDDASFSALPAADASISSIAADIIDNEGHAVLFSGCVERITRSVPQFGVTLAVFDVLNDVAVSQGWLLSSAV